MSTTTVYVDPDNPQRRTTIIRLDDELPAEPTAAEPGPAVVVRPGSQWAAAARRQGPAAEDEYIDSMRSRYGGEW